MLSGEEGGIWAWERFNTVFNWMPLAAIIEKRVICMHGAWAPTSNSSVTILTCPCARNLTGGIGKTISSVDQLEVMTRPLTMETGGNVLMDLLWRYAHHIHPSCRAL